MKISRENIDDLNAVVKVFIEKSDYEKNVADKLKEYRKKVALPGFRPGFVPASLIQKKFGKAFLAEEVNQLLSHNLANYFKEQNLPILGEPLPNETNQKSIDWDTDQDFEFAFDIALAPDVVVTIDKTRVFPYYRIKVTDEMIDKQIETIAGRMGSNIPAEEVSDKSSVRGDFFQLDDKGNVLDGGICPKDVLILIGMIKDEVIRNHFKGKKVGDTVVFNPVTAFENRHEIGHMLNIGHEEAENLNSQFRFNINEIQVFEPSQINEDFFKKFYGENSEVNTVEEFRMKIENEISASFAYSSDQKFAIDARDKLITENVFALPEEFLKRWLKAANKGISDEEIEKDFEPFLKDLHWQLIKKSISKTNNLVVEEEEIKTFARQLAMAQYNQHGIYQVGDEQLSKLANIILEKEEERERIYRRIFENKIMQVIREKAGIDIHEISREEFYEMMK